MTVLTDRDQTSAASSPYLSATLPTGVFVEGKLQTKALFREMTGHEEDLLTSKRFTDEKVRIQGLIQRCMVQLGDLKQTDPGFAQAVASLPDVDTMFCVLRIREASLGALMRFKTTCPCERKIAHDLTVDLSDLKFSGCKDPERKNYSGTLPSGKTFVAKYSDAAVSKELQSERNAEDYKSVSLLLRLVELAGRTDLVLNDVKALGLRDRNYLREIINSVEGNFEDNVDVTCSACAAEFKVGVALTDPSFFFPSDL